jgi:molybdopterin-guanine dinucleotide biosynthesis protein A
VADRELTGLLLVGGASTRFGSPKALATVDGETLAQRAWKLLGEACSDRIAVGKSADELELPFEILEDAGDVRAPLAGLVAGLRAARTEIVVAIPVDMPRLTVGSLHVLADACRDAAVPPTGPLPGAYRRSALANLERYLDVGELRLRDAIAELDVVTVDLDASELANVNTPDDVRRL